MTTTAIPELRYLLREGRPTDRAFVLSSWLGSDRFSATARRAGPHYAVEHRRLAESILDRRGVSLRVACDPEDEDAILGWALGSFASAPSVLYYCYVREGVRHAGIARRLLSDLVEVYYTHEPADRGKTTWVVPNGWSFNPYKNWR